MAFATQQLPVFVYGTLRRGQGNHRLLVPHAVAIHAAELAGHRLYATGVPYAAPGGTADTVAGELVSLDPQTYDTALRRLDRLEGVEYGLYVRKALPVRLRCGCAPGFTSTPAWVYLGGEGFTYSSDLLIPGGDWVSAARVPVPALACA